MDRDDPLPPRPFEHVHAPKSALYRRVMHAFVDAKRRFLVHLRPEDVADSLGLDAEAAIEPLASLVAWGNLRADPDTSRVTTVEDFYRSRYLYQLTPEGEAAELALEAYDRALGRRGELQSVALEDIQIRVRSLQQQSLLADPDPAVVHGLLRDLTTLLDGLAANAAAFMSGLQRTIDLQDADEDAFIAYKDRLIGYLERFLGDLVVKSSDIAATLHGLDAANLERLLEIVAQREAADAAPDPDEATCAVARALEAWSGRWRGLRAWFLGDRTHPSQAQLLRQRARAAIPALLAAVTTLQERRGGRSDRSADFRALARWFAQTPSDADAHRLWRAAFGLTAARHLTVDEEAVTGREGAPASASWIEAAPVEISPRLRATGHYQRRGMPARVADRSEAKRMLAERLEAERAQTEAARRRLATGRPVRLSDLRALQPDEFGFFLSLLGDALAAGPPEHDTIATTTSDGSLEVTLRPLHDGAAFEIETPNGAFGGPDHEITITDVTAPATPDGRQLAEGAS